MQATWLEKKVDERRTRAVDAPDERYIIRMQISRMVSNDLGDMTKNLTKDLTKTVRRYSRGISYRRG